MSTAITRAIESKLAEVRGQLASLSIEAVELENALATMHLAASEPELLQPSRPVINMETEARSERAKRARRDAWTAEELETLRTDYPRLRGKITDLLPGRSGPAIRSKAKALGVKCGKGKASSWTGADDELLREHFPQSLAAAMKALPHRTDKAITVRASVIGVRRHFVAKPKRQAKESKVSFPVALRPPATIPERPVKQPRTFEEDLEAVRNGARIVEVHPIRMPPPDRTLGGVSPEII